MKEVPPKENSAQIRKMLLTADQTTMEMALTLAESLSLDLSPIEEEIKVVLEVAKLQPRLGQWKEAKMENLLYPLGMILALTIENTWLPDLSGGIGFFRRVGIIELHNIYLQAVPEEIQYLKNLRSLSLKNNRLKTLPESIGELIQLKSLNLHDNQLIALPDSLAQLELLEVLVLSKNPQLRAIPYWVGQLPSLKRLVLDENVFGRIIPPNLITVSEQLSIEWELIRPDVF